jgi:hypothetical protein
MTALGTQQVLYFRRVPSGLMSNNGELYLNAAGLAEVARQEQVARQQQLESEAAAIAVRAENERQLAIASAHDAEQRRVTDGLAQQRAEAARRATVKALEASACTEGEYNVTARPELSFTLSDRRECWTPWLVPEKQVGSFDESGAVLCQLMLTDGTLGKDFESYPGKNWSNDELREIGWSHHRALRFKSLKKTTGPDNLYFALEVSWALS